MRIAIVLLLFIVPAFSQDGSVRAPSSLASNKGNSGLVPGRPPEFVLGPRDEITLSSVESEEISGKALRIDEMGEINVPLVGRMHAGGLTVEQLEAELSKRLQAYLVRPAVSVAITDFGSQPVSVIGAVGSPGVHQLRGRRTLVEVLALAGGLRPDAGNSIRITRPIAHGRLPLKNVEEDVNGGFTSGVVSAQDVLSSLHPEENIGILPGDVIAVSTAQMVYVLGDVSRPGGFVLNERESISALRALSMAGGLMRSAAGAKAKIFRAVHAASKRDEIPVDLKRIAKGQAQDVPLLAQDILYVPSSTAKRVAARAAEAAVQTMSGVAIFTAAR